jgi:imidazole glycerol-phosphate synthase subunit HisF
VIASGGAGCAEHFADVLTRGKADAALAASIFHYGKVRVGDLKAHLRSCGIPVRLSEQKVSETPVRIRSAP